MPGRTNFKRVIHADLWNYLHKVNPAFTRNEIKRLIDLLFTHIFKTLAQGKEVNIRNFGAFHLKYWKTYIGRNPRKLSEEVEIPGHMCVKFKPSEKLRKEIIKLSKL